MADREKNQRPLHVVMFPWLAQGHITPMVELAKSLDAYGLRISFVSTPLNNAQITQQLLQTGVALVELPMPSVDGLPTGIESTADLTKIGGGLGLRLIPLLIEAMDRLQKPFEALLKLLSPDFVIHDMVQYRTPRAAAKLGIPTITFMVLTATSTSYTAGNHALRQGLGQHHRLTADDLTVSPPGFPSSLIRRRIFEARKVLQYYQKMEEGERPAFMERRFICCEESWAIACNTCVELEGKYVNYLQKINWRPVFPVGILMPNLPPRTAADPCLAWLDRQPARSVMVASFGSECTLSGQELGAVVLGFEESEVSFLCILFGHEVTELPHGFVDRTRGRGLVVTEWAPLLHILNHPSTGASFTHGGWNSITEGLRFGVPFIVLPMQYDHGLNAGLVVHELKVGVEVRRNEEDGSFTKEDVSKAVRAVMVEEQGSLIKSNVEQIRNVVTGNDCHVHRTNIENFVSLLKQKTSDK